MAKKVAILGAGMAGLGAGLRLSESGKCEVNVFEQCGFPGGMAATIFKDDCVLDYGVHGLFVSKKGDEPIVDKLKKVLEGNLITTNKMTAIYFNNKYVNYPLRMRDLFATLNLFQMIRCFTDFTISRVKRRLGFKFDDRSFEGWISSRFGKSLYRLYFGPYAEKVWGLPADTLDATPLVRRVTTVSLGDVIKKAIKNILGLPVESKREYSQQPVTFLYGKRGTYSITHTIQDIITKRNVDILFGHKVKRINISNGSIDSVEVHNGEDSETYECDYVISTIRLTDLVRFINPRPPQEVLTASDKLIYRGLILVFLIIDRPKIFNEQWVYYSYSDVIFNRVNEFKNLNESFAPPDKTALCAEITCFEGDDLWKMTDEEIFDLTKKDFQKLSLFETNDISGYVVRRLPAVYPLYDLETAQLKQKVYSYITDIKNLYSIGRLGLFDYMNMDEVVSEGFEAANDILKEAT